MILWFDEAHGDGIQFHVSTRAQKQDIWCVFWCSVLSVSFLHQSLQLRSGFPQQQSKKLAWTNHIATSVANVIILSNFLALLFSNASFKLKVDTISGHNFCFCAKICAHASPTHVEFCRIPPKHISKGWIKWFLGEQIIHVCKWLHKEMMCTACEASWDIWPPAHCWWGLVMLFQNISFWLINHSCW